MAAITTAENAKQEAILTVRNLHKVFNAHKKSEVRAVDDVSFSIYKGETFGLVGESGSGKSTTGRVLIKLEDITSGSVFYKGKDITQIKKKADRMDFRRSMQMIFQDPFASLNPRIPVKQIIGDALKLHGICKTKEEINKRVVELMDIVGINRAYINRYPTEFSGGQCQRIGIDECLSALDVSIQAQIVNLLIRLQREQGMTYLFIAHDLAMVKYISDRIGVMKDGKILELAPANELYSHPLHPYTISLLSASPLTDLMQERKRQRIDYDPSAHRYPEGSHPAMHEITPGHFVYCLEEEIHTYKQQLA